MRRFFTLLLILAVSFNVVNAHNKAPQFNVQNLYISWEVVDNNYQNKPQALTALIITNKGKDAMPAGGWKIYFNSSRNFLPAATSGNARIEQVNGDLYSITPNNSFKAILPGESGRIEYVCESTVVNFTDAIEGPYFVWDAEPNKGILPGDFIVKPYNPTYKGLITPEVIYNQNKVVQDIP
ncbi:MAG TPA: carbohydate-binding domain-containing protein, partial [Pedobacter sp.]